MSLILLYLLAAVTAFAALQGVRLTAGAVGGQRLMARRLARARAAPAAEPSADEGPTEGPLARFIDARAPWLKQRLKAAGAPFTPVQVVAGSLTGTLVLLALMRMAQVPMLVALAAAGWGGVAGPLLLISLFAARRRRQFLDQMPQTIEMIARSLQAGHPVTTAMAVAARQMPDPIGPEFGVVIAEMNFGLERDAALRGLLKRFPLPELRMFAATLEVTRETGGNVAEVLLKLAEVMRAKAQLHKKVRAISAEGRLTFWVVSALPFLVGGAIFALNPRYYRDVVGDPLFWPMMAEPPVLLATGAFIIWRMVNFRI